MIDCRPVLLQALAGGWCARFNWDISPWMFTMPNTDVRGFGALNVAIAPDVLDFFERNAPGYRTCWRAETCAVYFDSDDAAVAFRLQFDARIMMLLR